MSHHWVIHSHQPMSRSLWPFLRSYQSKLSIRSPWGTMFSLQYIPWNMYMVLLCLVLLWLYHQGFMDSYHVSHSWKLWVIMMPTLSSLVPVMTKLASWWFSLSSGYMLYWHGMIVPAPVKCYWWIWKWLFNTRPYSKQNTNRVYNSWDIQCNTDNKISYD